MNIKKTLSLKQPEVGNFIRELRTLFGLTQEEFAAHLGVTFPTVNRWENGRNQPSKMAMRQLEKMLVDVGDSGQELLKKYTAN
ncbi:MAG: helix-turn-helix transcriptional regulator [Mastigocoleus sp. MO_167.B18]|nr:helix-turn-helix transcriptional regulator [Mastigocoleus sp. MO_167.B18]